MSITNLQKKTSQAIVNCFETGKILGDYSKVTVLRGDSGHLTYGKSQTTLSSGNLYNLLEDYIENDGEYSSEISSFMDKVYNKDTSLDYNEDFKEILKEAGDDPIMMKTQDNFFDRVYWTPAMKEAKRNGIVTPLGCTVVYDSFIHGSWFRIKEVVVSSMGDCKSCGEEEWISDYILSRREWLGSHRNRLLRKTIYRMDTLWEIREDSNWKLKLPIKVRGNIITEETLNTNYEDTCIFNASAFGKYDIYLRHKLPYMRGETVTMLQKLLNAKNPPDEVIPVDGVYGERTLRSVVAFQFLNGLKPDGIVGPVTWSELLEKDKN